MYISSFHIDGFGIFANVEVNDLPPGMSIFYGQNEAGKSTCLEFLRAMLTGFPQKGGKLIRNKFMPVAGGQPGGSLTLKTGGESGLDELRLTRGPNVSNGLALYTADGEQLDREILDHLLRGVNQEVYRKVFGFSLGELETFESLSAEAVRNALYGASFGAGLVSPAKVLEDLKKQAGKIFKPGGGNQPFNLAVANLENARTRIRQIEESQGSYDALSRELNLEKDKLAGLREQKGDLEGERRALERRLAVWRQWDQWRLCQSRLERMGAESGNFPEDAQARLARIEEALSQSDRQMAGHKEKLRLLREKRDALTPDGILLELLPELRRLAERKSSYRQALARIKGQEEARDRAQSDLEHGLEQLGPGWDCQRIRATDRSLFARRDLEGFAREMTESIQAHKAATDYLGRVNNEVETCDQSLALARRELEMLPEATAILNDQERDDLRQNMARLEESRRMEPARERAVQSARQAFERALEQLHISPHGEDAEKRDAAGAAILDDILANQEMALNKALEVREQIANAAKTGNKLRQAEENAEAIRKKIEKLRLEQRGEEGPSRDILDARTRSLRNLRSIAASISAEEERLGELDTRIADLEPPQRAKNWFLLIFGILFLLCGLGIFGAINFMGIHELKIADWPPVMLNLWQSYAALAVGVIMLASCMPRDRGAKKRHLEEMGQLTGRRDACASRLGELKTKANGLCGELDIDSYDPIALDASELLLERERELYFHEEHYRQGIEALQADLGQAKQNIAGIQVQAQRDETDVQQARRRWHTLMQGLQLGVVPSPESAATVFARVEAARLAYDNVDNAQKELDALWEDLHILEESITSMPAIGKRLEDAPEPLSLAEAVRLTLEACRDADLIREQRISAQATLRNVEGEMERIRARQEEAAANLEVTGKRMTEARAQWSKCLDGLGLGENLDPETVREAFKYMENCLAAEERLAASQRELAQSANEIQALAEPLAALLAKTGVNAALDSGGQTDWLVTLDNILAEAEKNHKIQGERENLQTLVSREEDDLASVQAEHASNRARESALFNQAGVDNAEDFLRLAERHVERQKLRADLEMLESALTDAAAPRALADFIADFKDLDQDSQEKRLAEISQTLAEITDSEQESSNTVGRLNAAIQNIANSDDLANMRQTEAMLAEECRRLAMTWCSRRLAEGILLKAKTIFEKERQPEVIRTASEIFSSITNGRWSGINISLEDSRLVILRPHGEPMPPEYLSRGAQEQAYLALRLAYIINHAKHAPSLPVIMDEILVNFDPTRADRTAHAFARLADGEPRQQILYFTCQPGMVDILRSASPGAPLFTVENGTIRAS